MQAIVINLEQAVKRMAFQHQQLGKLGINYKRLSANCPSHQAKFEQ